MDQGLETFCATLAKLEIALALSVSALRNCGIFLCYLGPPCKGS